MKTTAQRLILVLVLALVLIGSVSASAVGQVSPVSPGGAKATGIATTVAAMSAARVPLSTTYVYITKSGKKYHRSGCKYLKKSKIKKTLKWCKSHGYKACSVCNPPK